MITNNAMTLTLARLPRIADARKANAATGRFFFSPDTLRFFNSEIESELMAGALFITSERPPESMRPAVWNGERRFTLRAALASGDVATVGAFGAYPSKAKARKAAARVAAVLTEKGEAEVEGQRLAYDGA